LEEIIVSGPRTFPKLRLTGGSVSQVAASWGIAPAVAAGFAALIFLSIKFLVLKRSDPLKWGLRLIPFYAALTGGILALFISMHQPTSSTSAIFPDPL
jgi:PiT family inorganic phosphate transporter